MAAKLSTSLSAKTNVTSSVSKPLFPISKNVLKDQDTDDEEEEPTPTTAKEPSPPPILKPLIVKPTYKKPMPIAKTPPSELSAKLSTSLSSFNTSQLKPSMAPAAIQNVLDTLKNITYQSNNSQRPHQYQSQPVATPKPGNISSIDPLQLTPEQLATIKSTAATLKNTSAPVIQQLLPYLNSFKKQNSKVAAGVKPLLDSLSLKRTIVQDVPSFKRPPVIPQQEYMNPPAPSPRPPRQSEDSFFKERQFSPKASPVQPPPKLPSSVNSIPNVKIASESAANAAQNLVNNLVSDVHDEKE